MTKKQVIFAVVFGLFVFYAVLITIVLLLPKEYRFDYDGNHYEMKISSSWECKASINHSTKTAISPTKDENGYSYNLYGVNVCVSHKGSLSVNGEPIAVETKSIYFYLCIALMLASASIFTVAIIGW